MTTESILSVEMLGGFEFSSGSGRHGLLSSRKASSLLAYLILHRDRPQARDLLAGRFWPELVEDRARRRLSHALWQIRTTGRDALEMDLLVSTTDTVQLNPALSVKVDVEEFESLVTSYDTNNRDFGNRERASALCEMADRYGGDLLAGHYDDWIDLHRRRLTQAYYDVLTRLVKVHVLDGDYDLAIKRGLLLVEAEPLREDWQRELMRLHALNGESVQAERQFDRCRRALRQELDVEPSPETAGLVERIRADHGGVGPFESTEPNAKPFIGRTNERAAILGRVNELVTGQGGAVLVEGEMGIGKSRLLEEVIKSAKWRGVYVAAGSFSHTSKGVAFGGLRDAIAPGVLGLRGERLTSDVPAMWLQLAARVVPEIGELVGSERPRPLEPEAESWRTIEAVAKVGLAQGGMKPALIVLEDVQNADPSSLMALAQMGPKLIESRVLLCLSYQRVEAERLGPVWETLTGLEAQAGSTQIVVPAFTEEEVASLVRSEMGGDEPNPDSVHQLAVLTGGNPYLILELMGAGPHHDKAGSSHLDQWVMDAESGEPGSISEVVRRGSLNKLIESRVSAESESVRHCLLAVAAAARPISSEVVAQIIGTNHSTAVDALGRGVDLGFLRVEAGEAGYVHEPTRVAVYRLGDEPLLIGFHSRLGSWLATETAAGPAELAHHALLAHQWGQAHKLFVQAGRVSLAINAYAPAAEHFKDADQAARQAEIDDSARIDELVDYEQALDICGHREAQAGVLERLAHLVSAGGLAPDLELRIEHLRSRYFYNVGDFANALRLCKAAIEHGHEHDANVGDHLYLLGSIHGSGFNYDDAVLALSEAVRELNEAGRSWVPAQLMLGRMLVDQGRLESAQIELEAGYAAAVEDADVRAQVDATAFLATLHLARGQAEEAESYFGQSIELASEIGFQLGEAKSLHNFAVFLMMDGRGGVALGLLERAELILSALGHTVVEGLVPMNVAKYLHFVAGDDPKAKQHAERAGRYFRRVGHNTPGLLCLLVLGGVDRRKGRRRAAQRLLEEVCRQAAEAGRPELLAQAYLELARVHLELENTSNALDALRRAIQHAGEQRWESVLAASQAFEARILASLGHQTEAAASLDAALPNIEAGAGRSHMAAWWSAEALEMLGDRTGAAEQVARAHRLLARNLDGAGSDLVERAWRDVPENRAIAEACERYFEQTSNWMLPAQGVSGGRPLQAEDFVSILWSLSIPSDWVNVETPAERRRARVLRLAQQAWTQGAVARVSDLATALSVSERTIKRDLSELRRQGHEVRTRRSI